MRISAGLRRGDGIYEEQTCCPKDAQCFPSWHHVKAAIGVCTNTYNTVLGSISTTHPLSSGPPRALSLLSSATGTKNKIRVSLPRVLIRSVLVVSWHRAMWFMQTRETSWPEARAAFRTVVCRSNTQLRQQVPIPVQPWRALCPSPEQHEKPSKLLSRIQLHGVANPSHTFEAVRQYARFQLSPGSAIRRAKQRAGVSTESKKKTEPIRKFYVPVEMHQPQSNEHTSHSEIYF
ncbi:hypothetical protein J3E68DRAFT_60842 [Trichoderma sp. SZMC 28012]